MEAGGRDVEGPDDGLFPRRGRGVGGGKEAGKRQLRKEGLGLFCHSTPFTPPHEALGPSQSGLGTADKMQGGWRLRLKDSETWGPWKAAWGEGHASVPASGGCLVHIHCLWPLSKAFS